MPTPTLLARQDLGQHSAPALLKLLRLLTLAVASCTAATAQTQAAEITDWQLTLRSERHSDALPLARLGSDDWQHLAPRRGNNLALLDDELRISRQQAGWTWSLLARQQATLVASDSALALAALVDSGRKPAADTRWQAEVRLRAFAGAGLALGRSQALSGGWSMRGEAQLLALGRWRERRLTGPVSYGAASGGYSFDLRSDEIHDRLESPFQQAFARRGAGLLLGADLAWDGVMAWANAGLRDGGWLHWRGVPQQQATLNTATQAQDSDGYLIYRPLIQGQNLQVGLTRWLPWRATLAAGAKLPGGDRLGLRLDTLAGFGALPSLLWQRPAAHPGALALGAEWRLHERRLDLMLSWQGLTLKAGADRIDGQARSRALALGWARHF